MTSNLFIVNEFCQTEQDPDAELIIQKTAFDVARFRDNGARIETDNIPHVDPERFSILPGTDRFIQHDKIRPVQQCNSDTEALLHTQRKLTGFFIPGICQTDMLQNHIHIG